MESSSSGPENKTESRVSSPTKPPFNQNMRKDYNRRPLDWQMTKQNLGERGQYLLETGIWSDCTFVVGLPPTVRVRFHAAINLPYYLG